MNKMTKKVSILLGTLLILAFAVSAHAWQATYFGQDLGLGESTPLAATPNANAAKASFFANLIGVGTEDFESFVAPTADFGVAGTATLGGDGYVTSVTPGHTNGFGRYAISGSHYWETNSASFILDFSDPVAAFGFYGIDLGDFLGQIVVTAANGLVSTFDYTIPHSSPSPGGSVIYWGLIDTDNPFTSIAFKNTGSGVDVFAFDDFSIGSIEQVSQVPVPAAVWLLGSGVVGLVGLRRKKMNA